MGIGQPAHAGVQRTLAVEVGHGRLDTRAAGAFNAHGEKFADPPTRNVSRENPPSHPAPGPLPGRARRLLVRRTLRRGTGPRTMYVRARALGALHMHCIAMWGGALRYGVASAHCPGSGHVSRDSCLGCGHKWAITGG